MKDTFQLARNATLIYEGQKVPAIFGPPAEATLNVVSLSDKDSILDVACGTGSSREKSGRRSGRPHVWWVPF